MVQGQTLRTQIAREHRMDRNRMAQGRGWEGGSELAVGAEVRRAPALLPGGSWPDFKRQQETEGCGASHLLADFLPTVCPKEGTRGP